MPGPEAAKVAISWKRITRRTPTKAPRHSPKRAKNLLRRYLHKIGSMSKNPVDESSLG